MPKTIKITMTPGGYEVVAGSRTTRFRSLDAAVSFARDHMERAEHIRLMQASID